MSLLKSKKENSIPAPVDADRINEGLKKLKDIMEEYNFGFTVQHQVIIVPKINDKQN